MDIQYIAGFFDGEGTITVCSTGTTPQVKVQVAQKTKSVILAFKEHFGMGNVFCDGIVWRWQTCGNGQARSVLGVLAPFLVVKHEQALAALQLLNLIGSRGQKVTIQMRVDREAAVERLKSLNHYLTEM